MLYIFTLHWNKKDTLAKLKTSLLPALSGLNYKWLIKDNASTDGSISDIKSWNDNNINLIEYPDNKQNYSQGMNLLLKESGAADNDFILMLNNDVVFNDQHSISSMIEIMNGDNDVGVVGAKLNYTNCTTIQHCGVLFHRSNGMPYHFRSGKEEASRDRMNRYFPAVTGAVCLTRASIFRESPFNEKYFWAFDDIDFNMRIANNLGKKIVCCGKTNISHEESSSLKKNPVNKMFFHHNCKVFIDNWKHQIDVSLSGKYEDQNFNLYGK